MSKFKKLLLNTSPNKVFLTKWLEKQGINRKITHSYKNNGWISSLGNGAFIKNGTIPQLDFAVEALQTQANLSVHFGGKTTLSQRFNVAHYLSFVEPQSELFVTTKTNIPLWFKRTFKNQIDLTYTDFLPKAIGLEEWVENNCKIFISTQERAFLEMLYAVPQKTSTVEAYQILELLPTLRPRLLMELLTQCKSIKVNRLFLYLASKTKHDWYDSLDISKINLGSGVRIIDKTGVYDRQFNIIVEKLGE